MTVHELHCRRCGAAHVKACKPQRPGGIDWVAIMAYQVRPGHEMTLEEIGEVAGCSRERIRQLEFAALRKLSHRIEVRKAVADALSVW